MPYKITTLLCLLIGLLCACTKTNTLNTSAQQLDNTLTKQEVKDGWTLLFDGVSMDHWHRFNADRPGKSWGISEGAMAFDPTKNDGGDIVTNDSYKDYELSLEWKIQDCGNSGIMFNVQEGEQYGAPYLTGPEMQVLDNKCHPDAKIHMHKAGDLYDMIETSEMTVRPAGEWNQIRIVSKDAKYSFYQNGVNVVNFEMHTPEWKAMVAKSKFKDWKDFGRFASGKIALQDHGDKVWYKNVKIKKL